MDEDVSDIDSKIYLSLYLKRAMVSFHLYCIFISPRAPLSTLSFLLYAVFFKLSKFTQ